MWRKIKIVFAVSIVSLSLGMTISSALAQGTARTQVDGGTTTMRDDNNSFDMGWLGLGGLAGLIGLMPRDRHDRKDNAFTR